MAYISFKTRKSLGRRYGIDPALLLEMERLNQEYQMAPGREARALSKEQFNKSMAFNEEQARLNRAEREEANKQAGKASMVGTAGNVLTTAAMIRGVTKGPKEPFFGEWGGKPPAGETSITSLKAGTPEFLSRTGATPPGTVDPAYIDTVGVGVGAGAGTDVAATYAAEDAAVGAALTGAETGATYGAGMSTGAMAGYTAAIEVGRRVTSPYIEEQVGTTAKHVAGVAAEAGKGLVIGSYIMPGIGTLIGGALGAIGGAIREATGINWLDPFEVIGSSNIGDWLSDTFGW